MTLSSPTRRQSLSTGLRWGLALAATAWAGAGRAAVSMPRSRSLALQHLHTHEQLALVYAEGESYLAPALGRLNRFLRDHYSGDVGVIDPRLFDLLVRVQAGLGGVARSTPFQVISGYRSPTTNRTLQRSRGGGVASRSLHMSGRAIDLRLPGVPLAELRDAARSLQGGGVGYYAHEQFVHIDTGAVRHW